VDAEGDAVKTPIRPPRASERGVALVWFALFLMMFLFFMALGIDMAKLAGAKTQLQNAADAAALAAASAVDPLSGQINHSLAFVRARETAQLNDAFIKSPEPVIIEMSDVVMLSQNRVQVTARRVGATSVVTQMASVLGLPSLSVTAVAVAQPDTARGVQCIVPIGVNLRPGESFTPGCGNLYTLKMGPGSGQRGNYGFLALRDCPESPCHQGSTNPHQLACLISNGWCCGMDVGQTIPVAPGNKGPAIDGVGSLFDSDTDRREGICSQNYSGNGKRMITGPTVSAFSNGASAPVTVQGFATFFLRNKPSKTDGTITGEFTYATTAGLPGGHSSSGGVSYVVRLTR